MVRGNHSWAVWQLSIGNLFFFLLQMVPEFTKLRGQWTVPGTPLSNPGWKLLFSKNTEDGLKMFLPTWLWSKTYCQGNKGVAQESRVSPQTFTLEFARSNNNDKKNWSEQTSKSSRGVTNIYPHPHNMWLSPTWKQVKQPARVSGLVTTSQTLFMQARIYRQTTRKWC